MINKTGWAGLIQNLSSPQSNNTNSKGSPLIVGRVTDIILDENHPRFEELGSYQSLGTVIFEPVGKFNTGVATNTAKPFYSTTQNYPLINELIIVLRAPTSIQNDSNFNSKGYYISNINLWNSPHANLLPNPNTPEETPSSTSPISEDTLQVTNINSLTNPSQNTFNELGNIHPLFSYYGDVIYEGRLGQSLRFGSTSKSKSLIKNLWSSVGGDDNPITILRNGQSPEIDKEGWVPITENINDDLSSIYLTSEQKLEVSNKSIELFNNFTSQSKPKPLNIYTNSQIFATSGRVVINAKEEDVLIGAQNTISLSSNKYININSQNLFADSKNIKLGSSSATESLILGDAFMKDFSYLLKTINNLCKVLEVDKSWPGGNPTPNSPLNTVASNLKLQVENFSEKIKKGSFTSKTSKTI